MQISRYSYRRVIFVLTKNKRKEKIFSDEIVKQQHTQKRS